MGIDRTKLGHGETVAPSAPGDDETLAPGALVAPAPVVIRPSAPSHESADRSVDPEALAAQIQSAADLPIVDRAHYRFISEHARGGLGRILRARDRRTGRIVAIKEMLGSSDDAARRFAREALITANLQHPAIVPVYELGRWSSGEPFYAMKLVAGRSFEDVIRGCTLLDERLARLPVVVSVAEALAYAHGEHVIHRDLKPANILVGDFGETVVIDWGLAKTIGADEPGADPPDAPSRRVTDVMAAALEPARTMDGAVMGTPSYMPPEQARGELADERADVYAIGAMLYHLISGAPPYTDRDPKTTAALLALVKAGPPTPIAVREPGAPSDLATIVSKALAPRRDDRYASARELADDLRRFTTGQLVRAHHYDRRTLVVRWLRRHRAALTVAAVLASVLVVGGALSVRKIVAERDLAVAETARADRQLAAALYEKGRIAKTAQEWGRAAMYYAASRRHTDTPAATWAAGLAEARAIVPLVRYREHAGWIRAVAIAPDGDRIASVDDGGWLRVWSPRDGRTLAARQLRKHALYAVAFAPDGRELAVAGDDGTIVRVDGALAPRGELVGHPTRVWALAYAPDGKTLASAGEDATVRLWSLASGTGRVLGPGHVQRVYALAFSRDGKRLASASDDRKLWLWDVATGTGAERGGHVAGGIRALAIARDGETIVTAGWDHAIRVWQGARGEPDGWNEPHAVHGVALEPTTGMLVTGGDFGAIHAWDLSTHQLVASLDAPGGQTTAIAFDRDGKLLVTAGQNGIAIAWDASAFRRLAAIGHRGDVGGLAFSPDGKRFISGGMDHTLRLWDAKSGSELARVVTGAATCGDSAIVVGDGFAATCDDATLRRWDARGRELAVVSTEVWLRLASLSPDGTTLAAGHIKGRLALFDVATWRPIVARTVHDHQIYGVQYGRDGRLVTASLDDHVKVWRGHELALDTDVKVGTDDGVLTAALSPDGDQLAIGSQDGALHVWDLRARQWRERDLGRDAKLGTVWRLAFSNDGRRLFTATDDGIVRAWDARAWRAAPIALDANEGTAVTLAVTPDDTTLVAGYKSGAIVLWDLVARRVRLRIGGRTRERGSCDDVATQTWVDAAHRAIVAAACTAAPDAYFARLAARTHQRLADGDVDVRWDWLE